LVNLLPLARTGGPDLLQPGMRMPLSICKHPKLERMNACKIAPVVQVEFVGTVLFEEILQAVVVPGKRRGRKMRCHERAEFIEASARADRSIDYGGAERRQRWPDRVH